MKITKILLIDWCLLLLSILSFFTGLELHLAGHGDSHEIWHNWAVAHVIASLLFLVAGACHIKTHSKWYRSLLKNGLGRKSKTTLAISIVFVATVITGIALLDTGTRCALFHPLAALRLKAEIRQYNGGNHHNAHHPECRRHTRRRNERVYRDNTGNGK